MLVDGLLPLFKLVLTFWHVVNCFMELIFPIRRRKDVIPRGKLNWFSCQFNQWADMLEQKGYYLLFDSASEEAMKEWAKQITPLDSIQIPSEIDLTLKSTKLFFEALQKKDNPYRITATGRFLMKTNFEEGVGRIYFKESWSVEGGDKKANNYSWIAPHWDHLFGSFIVFGS